MVTMARDSAALAGTAADERDDGSEERVGIVGMHHHDDSGPVSSLPPASDD